MASISSNDNLATSKPRTVVPGLSISPIKVLVVIGVKSPDSLIN